MSDVLSAHHYPALRVGGRRLSISARPKPHNVPGSGGPSAPVSATPRPTENVGADYPRPAAQGEGEDQAEAETHPPLHDEDETPKKEKKHGHGGRDQNRLKESGYCKLDTTMPSKGQMGAKHTFGAAGRIGQPMGRVLAV